MTPEQQMDRDYIDLKIDGTEVRHGEYYIAILLIRLTQAIERQTEKLNSILEDREIR